MTLVPLKEADEEAKYGGKAWGLAQALQAGLEVPPGFAIDHRAVQRVLDGSGEDREALEEAFAQLRPPVAVRSSAVGEDSARASFAGQHLTLLNVTNFDQLLEAMGQVVASVLDGGSEAYRSRLDLTEGPRMGIVVQQLLQPDSAGVLFTANPMSNVHEVVVEAAWGLGEAVVSGLVIPDHYRLDDGGALLDCRIGDKDLVLRTKPDGGTEEIEVPPEKRQARVLSDEQLEQLGGLARRCEAAYGANLDIEWCFEGEALYLLQCRPITTHRRSR